MIEIRKHPKFFVLLTLLCFIGCANRKEASKSTFKSVLNEDFKAHNQPCLIIGSMPQTEHLLPGFRNDTIRQLDALVDAGLLSQTSKGNEKFYDLTSKGKEYWKTEKGMFGGTIGQLCYGRRHVTEILQFTVPGTGAAQQTTEVAYQYTIVDIPKWAQSQAVQAVFPAIATTLHKEGDSEQEHALLILMNDGWTAQPR